MLKKLPSPLERILSRITWTEELPGISGKSLYRRKRLRKNRAFKDSERNIANKLALGSSTAVFFVQCLTAIGCQTVRLRDE